MRFTSHRRSLATVTGVLLSAVVSLGLQATPAQAAYGPCNTTGTYGGEVVIRVPARTDNGTSCYIGYQTGSVGAVKAVQDAIYYCYRGTTAYDRMMNAAWARWDLRGWHGQCHEVAPGKQARSFRLRS